MTQQIIAKPAQRPQNVAPFDPKIILEADDLTSVLYQDLRGKRTEDDQLVYSSSFLTIPKCKVIVTDRDIFYLDQNDCFYEDYYPKPWVYSHYRREDGTLAIPSDGLETYVVPQTVYAPFVVAGNWFHLLLDNYARMYFFEALACASLPVVFPHWCMDNSEYYKNDQKMVNSIFMEGKDSASLKKGIYIFDRVILPPLGNLNDYIFADPLKFISQRLRTALLPHKAFHPTRLFISRADIAVRNLSNEAELIAALMPLGVTPICPGDYSFRAQLELFSAAELIIGVHGQGFTPMICASECRRVMEFEAADWNFTAYRSIASCFGIPYEKMPCELQDYRNQQRFDWLAKADIDACVARVEQTLRS